MNCLAMIVCLAWHPVSQEVIRWREMGAGPTPVGFRTYAVTRAAGGKLRTIQVAMWYPAVAATEQRVLTFKRYFALAQREGPKADGHAQLATTALSIAVTGDSLGLSKSAAQRALDSPMLGSENLTEQPGRAPLVVWSSRHGTVAAQAALSEVLASQGAIVVTAWSNDAPLVYPWERKGAAAIRLEEDLRDTTGTIDPQSPEPGRSLCASSDEVRRPRLP